MSSPNGAFHKVLDEQFDAFRDSMRKLIDRVDPREPPSKLRAIADRTTELIKAHPIAAAGIALGIGYAIVRIARR